MKIRFGMGAQLSGSMGGVVASHNRGGAYLRARSVPTTSTSNAALNAKAYLATASQGWQGLTSAQRLTWEDWAAINPVTDKFGEQRVLSGHQAYVQLNRRLLQASIAAISVPPVTAPPVGLLTFTGTYDIGMGDFQVVYTATPLGAAESLYLWGAVVNSAGRAYVQNLYKLVYIGAAATASPIDAQTELEARFGTLQVGQYVHWLAQVLDRASGRVSTPSKTSGVVVTT